MQLFANNYYTFKGSEAQKRELSNKWHTLCQKYLPIRKIRSTFVKHLEEFWSASDWNSLFFYAC